MRQVHELLKHSHFKPSINKNKHHILDHKTKYSPTIFLHGFLGSKKNFTKIGKSLTNNLLTENFTLDLRNHGDSFHSTKFNYNEMTNDLIEFINHYKLSKFNLVGYSMGAKIALNYSILYPNKIDKLICIDNCPIEKQIPIELFDKILNIMNLEFNQLNYEIDINKNNWKNFLFKFINNLLQNNNLSLYLLDNFKFNNELNQIDLKIPKYILTNDILKKLSEFPIHPLNWKVQNQLVDDFDNNNLPRSIDTLFIKALKSSFIDNKSLIETKELIKNFKLIEYDDTHHGILINHYNKIAKDIENFIISEKNI
ncbi:hypothetical protein WICMUC_002013 [Wickerhamomyces mucosus]|uniref:AB hydrolase-1 domain-containing protein n=1 Tax=Wickerhamomyces mucosus TaxID=1378264 RepID=A0A9P8PQG3_9ASCO|nr:hypothetical protein WICMUC_002013 [Wickerhamomyces mucosus]